MEIESLAETLEREHHEVDAGIAAFTAGSPAMDRDRLVRAICALRRHIYLEEEYVFPLLYQADRALVAPLSVMLREHAQLWETLAVLEAEPDARAALAHCRRLTSQLLHHNLKEEKIIYPRTGDLPPAAADRLRAVLATAGLPDGWVCTRARAATPPTTDGAAPH